LAEEKIQTGEKIMFDTHEYFNRFVEMNSFELEQALLNAQSEKEREFYLFLYNQKISEKQSDMIASKEFDI